MYYGQKSLFPPMGNDCDLGACVRVPLFQSDRCGNTNVCGQRVVLENPCCPGECAEVLLGVDSCGNLTVCVRRPPCLGDPCGCPRPVRRSCKMRC